jgi:hypothetical protein
MEMVTTCTECGEEWSRTPRHRTDCDVMLHPKKWGVDRRDYRREGGLWWKKYDHKHGYSRKKHNDGYQKMNRECMLGRPQDGNVGKVVLRNIRFEVDMWDGPRRVRPIYFPNSWVQWFYEWNNGEWVRWEGVLPHEPPDPKRFGFSDIIEDADVVMPWANVVVE